MLPALRLQPLLAVAATHTRRLSGLKQAQELHAKQHYPPPRLLASRCSDMQPLALAPGKALLAPLQSNVLIVYTGGTIGMQPGSDGALKPCKGFLTDMIPKMDELLRPGMPLTTGPSLPSQR